MRAKQSVVRILDVARAAGVSVTTASRVLNNKDDVAPETYEKVRRVMAELSYTASLAPGEARTVTFQLDACQLGFYDLAMDYVVEPGDVEVLAGSSSQDIRVHGIFTIVGATTNISGDKVFFSKVQVQS